MANAAVSGSLDILDLAVQFPLAAAIIFLTIYFLKYLRARDEEVKKDRLAERKEMQEFLREERQSMQTTIERVSERADATAHECHRVQMEHVRIETDQAAAMRAHTEAIKALTEKITP